MIEQEVVGFSKVAAAGLQSAIPSPAHIKTDRGSMMNAQMKSAPEIKLQKHVNWRYDSQKSLVTS
jgi:hypothetical protein